MTAPLKFQIVGRRPKPGEIGTKFARWAKNRTPTRDAFAKYYESSADEVLAMIEADAVRWIRLLADKAHLKSGMKGDIRRRAFAHLGWCAKMLAEPPPPALVTLLGILMGVKEMPRGRVKSTAKFRAAAEYVAQNPEATVIEIKRAVKGDPRVIAKWQQKPVFKDEVSRFRQIALNESLIESLLKSM